MLQRSPAHYCEKTGSLFRTHSEVEYFKHGDSKHRNKPTYHSMASIQENGPQGKDWEV
jgi:hypothetical protein